MTEKIEEKFNLDADQQAAYLADQNVVVSAGAGSGKTTVLTERYVRLVTQGGLGVSEVLTLTFTRKAAAGMYARIFKRLGDSSEPLAKERLAQFDQARISTLDSFCTSLTKGASYRYGISGDFRVDETELRRTAEETAMEVIMRHCQDEAVCRLVATHTFESIVQDLFADLAMAVFSFVKPGNYTALGKKQIDFIKEEFKICCQEMTDLCKIILAIDASKSTSKILKQAQIAVGSRYPIQAVFDPAHIEQLIETAQFFISSASFSLPGNVTGLAMMKFKETAVVLKKDKAEKLLSLAITFQLQEDILFIGMLLDEYETLFLEQKRVKGLLSFRDTGELAVDILTKDQELRNYYKRHIKAIMIDEFQDNNALQKNLLYLLAEQEDVGVPGELPSPGYLAPDKLFFVGDEKQSIYRFRGADVSVFRGLAEELGKEDRALISLSTNYRSAPELVDFFNALFPGVFGKAEASFEAEFSPMHPSPAKLRQGADSPPLVEVFLQETYREIREPEGEEEEEDFETSKETGEALAAAKRIITGVEQREFSFGDVAVLFKSMTHQNEYERTFRKAGIPFSAADPRGLFLEGPANDFYAILRLSLFPSDRNAYATTLRSPFVSLGDESVFRIMLEQPDEPFLPEPPETWFAHPADRERYEQGRAIFTQLQNRIDIQGIALVLAYLWYETGYRISLLYDESSRPNLEHFEYLYALALDADQRRLSMGAFLDELAPRIGTTDKTETGDIPELKDQVLFITVHKSKGLEFPVVILANAGSVSRGSRNDKPYFLDPEYGHTINLKQDTSRRDKSPVNYFYSQQKDFLKRQEEAELKRLFYVAATRARDRFILVGSRDITKQDESALVDLEGAERLKTLLERGRFNSKGELQKKSFLDLFSCGFLSVTGAIPRYQLIPLTLPNQDAYKEEIKGLRNRTAVIQHQEEVKEKTPLSPEAFYALPAPPAASAGAVITTPSLLENYDALIHPRSGVSPDKLLPLFDTEDYLRVSGKETSGDADLEAFSDQNLHKAFGSLCHSMIEILITGYFPDEDLKKSAYHRAQTQFRQANLSEKALKALAEEALKLAQDFLNSSEGREAVASPNRQVEFPFILPLHPGGSKSPGKPVVIQGKIDLIYEYQGTCVIVDFKIDRYVHPESHRVQLACYRAAAKAFSDLPVKTVLMYLRKMVAVPFDAGIPEEELFELTRGVGPA